MACDRVAHVAGYEDLVTLGRLRDACRDVDDVADDVVAHHHDAAEVDAGAQPQRRRLTRHQFETREHCGLRLREREQQPVAEALHHATSAAAHDRPHRAVVLRDQLTGGLVPVALRPARESFEVGERDREAGRLAALVVERRCLG